jgi:hypothetical protein
MAQKMEDSICAAIEALDAKGLCRLAAAVRSAKRRMLLLWLAKVIEDQLQRDIRRRQRLAR